MFKVFFNFAIIFVVFDIEPRRARTRILKTTKKFPCRIIDRGHFYFARRGQTHAPFPRVPYLRISYKFVVYQK